MKIVYVKGMILPNNNPLLLKSGISKAISRSTRRNRMAIFQKSDGENLGNFFFIILNPHSKALVFSVSV